MTTTTTEFIGKAAFYKSAMLTRPEYRNYVRLLRYNAAADTYDIEMIGGTRDTAARSELSEFCL